MSKQKRTTRETAPEPEDEGDEQEQPTTSRGRTPQQTIESAEKILAAQKRWREKNKDKIRSYQKSWRDKNKEKVRAAHKKYQDSHAAQVKEWHKKSRMRQQALLKEAREIMAREKGGEQEQAVNS